MTYTALLRKWPRYLAFSTLHMFYSSIGQTFLIALFVPYIREQFSFSNTEFSGIYALATLLSAIVLPFSGKYIDKVNLRLYSTIACMLLAIGCFVMSVANHVVLLLLGIFLLRQAGQGLMSHIGATSAARYFHKNRGKALGVKSFGLPLGEAVMPIMVIQLIYAYGWQTTYALLGIVVLFLFFPLGGVLLRKEDDFQHPTGQENPEESVSEIAEGRTRSEVLRTKIFYAAMAVGLFMPFTLTGLFFHQAELALHKGWSLEWMASCFIAFAITHSSGGFLVGPLIDKFSAYRLFALHLIPFILGLFILASGDHPLIALLYLAFAGLSVGAGNAISTALWPEIYGVTHLGAIKSMVSSAGIFSTAASPILFGYFLDTGGSFDTIIWIASAYAVIFSLIFFKIPQPYKDIQ